MLYQLKALHNFSYEYSKCNLFFLWTQRCNTEITLLHSSSSCHIHSRGDVNTFRTGNIYLTAIFYSSEHTKLKGRQIFFPFLSRSCFVHCSADVMPFWTRIEAPQSASSFLSPNQKFKDWDYVFLFEHLCHIYSCTDNILWHNKQYLHFFFFYWLLWTSPSRLLLTEFCLDSWRILLNNITIIF